MGILQGRKTRAAPDAAHTVRVGGRCVAGRCGSASGGRQWWSVRVDQGSLLAFYSDNGRIAVAVSMASLITLAAGSHDGEWLARRRRGT